MHKYRIWLGNKEALETTYIEVEVPVNISSLKSLSFSLMDKNETNFIQTTKFFNAEYTVQVKQELEDLKEKFVNCETELRYDIKQLKQQLENLDYYKNLCELPE